MRMTSVITRPFRAMSRFLSRNLAFADNFLARMGQPVFNNWTIRKAVTEGYRINGWVYRAISLTMKTGGSVPWGIVDKDNTRLPEHHLDVMLQHPFPHMSRQKVFELWISHLELSGNAFALKVKSTGSTINDDGVKGQETNELWPVSPDRIRPVTTEDVSEWISGYSLDTDPKVKWLTEEMIHFSYLDPANPLLGIGPLQAAGVTVDIDTDQRKWNKAAMQNQGVMSGIFSFKREFNDQDEADAIAESLNDRYAGAGNARRIGVLGSEAKYHRIGATPQELDFGDSRVQNRNEIFIIFGVPIQYAGGTEASTYNNYQTSELVFWFQKVIPLLDDLKDTLNLSLRDELKDGEQITYFLDDIPAIRRAMLERSRTARNLFSMGVPFERLNKVFKFGVEEFDGWEKSFPGGRVGNSASDETAASRATPRQIEHRDIIDVQVQESLLAKRDVKSELAARDKWSEQYATEIEKLLTDQQKIINNAIADRADQFGRIEWVDPELLLRDTWEADWVPVYNNLVRGYSIKAANQILVIDHRADDELKAALEEYIKGERVVLTELSHIEKSTVDSILLHVENGLAEGMSVNELQQSIIDAGIFEPARALQLSRTITGTAASMGQFIGARQVGATHKKWIDSGFNVRDEHRQRNAEAAVGVNGRFSPKFGATTGPRYPLDPDMPVADRVNCRCSMFFEIRDVAAAGAPKGGMLKDGVEVVNP